MQRTATQNAEAEYTPRWALTDGAAVCRCHECGEVTHVAWRYYAEIAKCDPLCEGKGRCHVQASRLYIGAKAKGGGWHDRRVLEAMEAYEAWIASGPRATREAAA